MRTRHTRTNIKVDTM